MAISANMAAHHEIQFDRVRNWLFDSALPMWATNGFDRETGVCRERLALDGTIEDPGFRRIRALARQIYVYSHAEALGWDGPAAEIADASLNFLNRMAWQGPQAGWARRLDQQGQISDSAPDLYDNAFALFALGWRYKVTGEARHLERAIETLDFLTTRQRAADGLGFIESPETTGQRIQNPHMHLLEALLVLASCSEHPDFLNEADRIVELFQTRLVDPATGALREFYAPGWAHTADAQGRSTEPGHQFEWVWILTQYEKFNRRDVDTTIRALFEFAERHGIEPDTGLTFDEVRDDGKVTRGSFRSWPQTETLKGYLAMGERTGSFNHARISRVIDNLFEHYLATDPPGLWIDQLDENRAGASTLTPATTLYHLFLAFAELLRLEGEIRAAG
ncbi:AGE family epimerase/isomerase [Maricaulis sp.]|uniref:AGE family epimerase/isomerase n=1 Tax=Maricaulis sp. TaxID=1486257 RepID=UPI003A95B5EE